MVLNQLYNIYLTQDLFISEDACVIPTERNKTYSIIEILIFALDWAKENKINRLSIYSNYNLEKIIHETYKEYFNKKVFPYFVDIYFNKIEINILKEHIIKLEKELIQKDFTKDFLENQEKILNKKKVKKINILRKGG